MPIHLPPLSRRQFIVRSLATGALSALWRPTLLAQVREVDPHCWALISDPHIHSDRAKMAHGINMAAQFDGVVREVLDLPQRPACVLINGDLAYNTGFAQDYATFTELIAPLRAAQIPLTLGLGNHDHRERFWTALRGDASVKRPLAEREVAIIPAARANWFLLDTLDKTNSTPGRLGEAQIAWLAQALDAHADKPALVMTHHNPSLKPNSTSLLDEDAFLAVLRPRRQVKALFYGHTHVWSVKRDESGLHLVNLPTTAYVWTPRATGWVTAQLETGGAKLHLQCIDRARPEHDQRVELAWRT